MSLVMYTGDLKPDLKVVCSADDAVNLTTATSVRIIGKRGDVLVFDRVPTLAVSGNTTIVTMLWVAGDTDNIGRIQVEVEATWPGGKKQTFRADGGVDIRRDFDQEQLEPPEGNLEAQAADNYVLAVLEYEGDAYDAIVDIAAETPGPPNGGAGGVLSGSYPNPGFAVNMAEQTELDAGLALKRDEAYLTGVPITAYGSSLVTDASSPAGGGYYRLVGTELNSGTVTTYGLGATRINHTVSSLITAGTLPGLPGPVAGALWPGVTARTGPVIIDLGPNDVGHYFDDATPSAISGAAGNRYLAAMRNLYQTALALASSQTRINLTASTTSGTWVDGTVPYGSAPDAFAFTTEVGASRTYTLAAADIPQTGPLAGRIWLQGFQYDPATFVNANVNVSIDGGAPTLWTASSWEVYGTVGFVHSTIPATVPADNASHTVTFTHAGNAGEFLTADALIVASTNPAPILVMAPPLPVVGVWNATQVATWKANLNKVEPKVLEAVALFPNAAYIRSTVTPEGMDATGVHYNPRGSIQRKNDVIEFFYAKLQAWMRNHQAGDAALPVVPPLT